MRYFFAILIKYLIEISVDSTEIPAYNSIKAKGAFADLQCYKRRGMP